MQVFASPTLAQCAEIVPPVSTSEIFVGHALAVHTKLPSGVRSCEIHGVVTLMSLVGI